MRSLQTGPLEDPIDHLSEQLLRVVGVQVVKGHRDDEDLLIPFLAFQIFQTPHSQAGRAPFDRTQPVVVVAYLTFRGEGYRKGTVAQVSADRTHALCVASPVHHRDAGDPRDEKARAAPGPVQHPPSVEEVSVAQTAQFLSPPSGLRRQAAAEQIGHHRRVVNRGVSEGDQKPGLLLVEKLIGSDQVLNPGRLDPGYSFHEAKIGRTAQTHEGVHPGDEAGFDELQSSLGPNAIFAKHSVAPVYMIMMTAANLGCKIAIWRSGHVANNR